ncbi:hypothetical protein [Bosea sp. Root381]|uniref:hypothetical protein n=1 Tax=Bosea sp. Root381 TaxID=1736524 RepID=UPI000AE341FC|nr:hypothetical protein [Bosea sp. Root381]
MDKRAGRSRFASIMERAHKKKLRAKKEAKELAIQNAKAYCSAENDNVRNLHPLLAPIS